MNQDGICYTNLSGYNTSWISPFEYEKQLPDKQSETGEKEKRFMIQGTNLRGPSIHYQSSVQLRGSAGKAKALPDAQTQIDFMEDQETDKEFADAHEIQRELEDERGLGAAPSLTHSKSHVNSKTVKK